jgi:hypothetical protein
MSFLSYSSYLSRLSHLSSSSNLSYLLFYFTLKVILALAAISSEMEFLVSEEELKMKFLDPILLYGSELSGLFVIQNEVTCVFPA